jgi:hypothetical protein
MNTASEKPRKFACETCQDTGLVVAPRALRLKEWDGRLTSLPGPARALPIPCALCEAGALEIRAHEKAEAQRVVTGGKHDGEIEIRIFRKLKG